MLPFRGEREQVTSADAVKQTEIEGTLNELAAPIFAPFREFMASHGGARSALTHEA